MRLDTYFRNIQLDLRLFLFLLLTLCAYRLFFMLYMDSYQGPDVTSADLLLANFAGLRLSLKSAGAFTAFSFLLATLPCLVRPGWSRALGKVRLAVGTLASFLLAVLFMARFPYYREFGQTYGLQVAAGLADDKGAIFGMMLAEYGLVWRSVVALLLTFFAFLALRWLLRLPAAGVPQGRPLAWGLGLFLFTAFFGLFVRFGGGVSYATGLNWENAAVTRDDFLNECILDDVQALYRAHSMEKKMAAGDIFGVDTEGAPGYLPYLERKAPGPRLPKPSHIFIVLGETWANWPLLDKYADLHLMEGLKGLARSPEGYYTGRFMPNGDFTSVAITGLVTGLTEVNIRANYQPRSFTEAYPTAMAPQLKALGYQVDFWYGGSPGWDQIGRLALAQGFDNFYGYPDYGAPKVNAWGTDDARLLEALARDCREHPERPTVALIMTTSNHPPYSIDLGAEGFDVAACAETIRRIIPEAENPEELAVEFGHYWYMDKVVTNFVREMQALYPDSLFVITGDHAVRSDPGPHPTLYEHQSVPCVIYGKGISPELWQANAIGGHTSIVPTLLDLIAPAGFAYQAIGLPLGEGRAAFNRDVFLADNVCGRVERAGETELIPGLAGSPDGEAARAALLPQLTAQRTLAWYLLTQGKE